MKTVTLNDEVYVLKKDADADARLSKKKIQKLNDKIENLSIKRLLQYLEELNAKAEILAYDTELIDNTIIKVRKIIRDKRK